MFLRRCAVLTATMLLFASTLVCADGLLLVGNKSANTLWALDVISGERRAEAATEPGPHELAVTPDRQAVVVSEYGAKQGGHTLGVYRLPGLELLRRIELGDGAAPHGSVFLPDGRLLVTLEGRGELAEVDITAGTVLRRIAVGEAHMVAVSPGARRAWVTNIGAGTLTRVDLTAGKTDGNVVSGKGAEGVAVTTDGAEVWVSNRDGGSVSVIDADSLAVKATLAAPGVPIRVAMTPDGKHALVTRAEAAVLSVFEVRTRRLVAEVALGTVGGEQPQAVAGRAAVPVGITVQPDGKRAFVALSGADQVRVIDTASWQVSASWTTGREPDALGVVEP
jgi:YVTN family beta-propeller protein